jgi:hypothetical protein
VLIIIKKNWGLAFLVLFCVAYIKYDQMRRDGEACCCTEKARNIIAYTFLVRKPLRKWNFIEQRGRNADGHKDMTAGQDLGILGL